MTPTIITRNGVTCSLYCGDCLEIAPEIGIVDAVITDPPFDKEAHTLQRRINRGTTRGGDGDRVTEEPLGFDALTETERDGVAEWAAKSNKGWFLAFCQAEAVATWRDSIEAAGGHYKRAMVWIKPDGMPQYSGDRPGMGYESIVAAWCGEGKSVWNGGGAHGVFTFPKNSGGKHVHPTQKPTQLISKLVCLFSQSGQLVCDLFMGSGTAGVCCLRSGRNFIGIEKDPKHFATAVERIQREANQGVLI